MLLLFRADFLFSSNFNLRNTSSIFKIDSGANFVVDNAISSCKGKIVKNAGGSFSGETISFDEGVFEDEGNKISMVGTLDPENDQVIILDGNKTLRGKKGTVLQSIQISGFDNKIEGEFLINSPIILQDSNSSVTFALTRRLNNNITLNNGTLYLNENLDFVSNTKITGSGTIRCNGRSLRFGSKDLDWEDPICFECGGDIVFNSNFSLSNTWTFSKTSNILCGNGNVLTLQDNGRIVVERGSSLELKDLIVKNVSGNKIRCLDDNGKIIFAGSELVLDDDYTFDTGSFEVLGDLIVSGSKTFLYDSSKTSTIKSNSELKIRDYVKFSLGRKTAQTSVEPLEFEDRTARLKFSNCTINVNSNGLGFKKGEIICCGEVILDFDSTSSVNGLHIGDGTAENDAVLSFNGASDVRFLNGHIVYNVTEPLNFRLQGKESKMCRHSTAMMYLEKSMTLQNLTIENLSPTEGMLPLNDDADLVFDHVNQMVPGIEFEFTGRRYSYFTYLLDGSGELVLKKGVLPLAFVVQSTGNKIIGSGSLSGPVILSPGSDVTFGLEGSMLNNITLNTGTVNLDKDLHVAHDNVFVGPGIVSLGENSLYLGTKDKIWTTPIYWDAGRVHIRSKISLSNTWTVSGNCMLNGYGQILDLGDYGRIVVERGSTLTLRDIYITGISGNKIRCLDNSGKVILDHVYFNLEEDFGFNLGSFEVADTFKIEGGYTFTYQSNLASTIKSGATMKLGDGVIFSYKPSCASSDLICFESSSAKIALDGATLHSTQTGLHLIKGKLEVSGDCYISSDATIESEGIIFGDGLDVNNDLKITVLPESTLDLLSGCLVYKNLS